MNVDGHQKKAKEIEGALNQLIPDPEGKYVAAIVELSYGMIQHIIACKMEKKYGDHLDTHAGLHRMLRHFKEYEIAEVFQKLDSIRAGRWYGSQGNGNIVDECNKYLIIVKEWGNR